MQNYHKYLSAGAEDVPWGLTVIGTGCSRILPDQPFPFPDQPGACDLDRYQDRVLPDYQLLYITRGAGMFESVRAGRILVGPGTLILIFAEEKHCYKPLPEKGWDEYWVGFNGPAARAMEERGLLSPEFPTLQVGSDERLLSLFLEIIEETKHPQEGSESLLAGALLHLLGYTHSLSLKPAWTGQERQEMVKQAQLLFLNSVNERTTPEQVAEEIGISYSRFRKLFKSQTGVAPGQYQIQLRIQKAKELLLDPAKSIKETAFALQFESSFYFSKLFKEKTGQSPQEYRRKTLGRVA